METFRNLSWNVPIEIETDFATAEQIKATSLTYKILRGSYKEPSSDSSDEVVAPQKNTAKKKKSKLKKKTKQNLEKVVNKGSVGIGVQNAPCNEDGIRYSSFSAAQHATFLNILLSVHNQIANIPLQWNETRQAVEAEQLEFLTYIKDLWKTAYEKHHILSDDAKRYTGDEWKSQLKRVKLYSQFYKPQGKIPLVYMDDKPEVQMVPVEMLLEMGVVPKLHVPTNNMSNKLPTDFSKMMLLNAPVTEDTDSLLHVTVSCDKNAEVLAIKERADVVISSSSLKCIADNTSPKFDKMWNIPVVVKEYSVKDGSSLTFHKVVYVDKKLPAKEMRACERNEWFHKLAVKTFFCHHKDPNAFRYPENYDISCHVKYTDKDDRELPKQGIRQEKNTEDFTNSDNSSESTDLVIDSDYEENAAPDISNTYNKRLQKTLGDTSSTNKHGNYTTIPPPSKTNVTYRLWKINYEERSKEELNKNFLKWQNSNKELRVLVRCKMDACEHENNKVIPVCVSCKMEYQAEHGAEKVTLSSLVREWVALFFRPEGSLRRIRINAITEEVMMTEKLSLRDLATMASHLHNLRIRRTVLGSLYQVMSDLVKLKSGHYLLSHDVCDGPFVCLLQQTNETSSFDLYADYEFANPEIVTTDGIPQWIPIDPNLITPLHVATQRIPATFQPYNTNKCDS